MSNDPIQHGAHTEIALGAGAWIVGHAIWRGHPCIIFTPAPEAGKPGDPADGEIPIDRLTDGAVVLRFLNMEAALSHLERLNLMMQDVQTAIADEQQPRD